MRGAGAARCFGLAVLAIGIVWGAGPAKSIEAFDGRFELHGFYEMQVRSLIRDFDLDDDWDLAQWYHVLNLEMEADIAPDGWGPFDLISAFGRVEVRYDCVWKRGCGVFSSADTYGNRAGRLPKRLTDGKREGLNGHLFDGDDRRRSGSDRGQQGEDFGSRGFPTFPGPQPRGVAGWDVGNGPREASRVWSVNGLSGFFSIVGLDGILGTADDPSNVIAADFLRDGRCLFGHQDVGGNNNGRGVRTLPLDPACKVRPRGRNINKPNPFRGPITVDRDPNSPTYGEFVDRDAPSRGFDTGFDETGVTSGDATRPPIDFINLFNGFGNDLDGDLIEGGDPLAGDRNAIALPGTLNVDGDGLGAGELPMRAAPLHNFQNEATSFDVARGVWIPNKEVARLLRDDAFSNFDQNFREDELAWNRGASQQDEKELKELYVDLELFDSQLWIRAGKQQIVWGKTELFRTTDQFNPRDLGLASLPSLEESRVALWALRGVWSFYEVGPFEDLRAEIAVNIDQFEPVDLGRCGEPFSPLPVCNKTFGLMAHGLTGLAVAGEKRPEDPWNSSRGFEIGARLEWRWSRFSFALTDFYGFNDFPTTEQIFRYGRNVDPDTGRPRRTMTSGGCNSNIFGGKRGVPGAIAGTSGPSDVDSDCLTPENALEEQSANQTLYALACASSVAFNNLDPNACGLNIFQSNASTSAFSAELTVGAVLGNLFVGNPAAAGFTFSRRSISGPPVPFPDTLINQVVGLNVDPCDGRLSDCDPLGLRGPATLGTLADGPGPDGFFGTNDDELNSPNQNILGPGRTINQVLTSQQKALLGCGEFYGTNCDSDGIDFMNAEVGVMMQSFVGIEGSGFDGNGVEFTCIPGPDGRCGNPLFPSGDDIPLPGAYPGTVNFAGGPVATRWVPGVGLRILPGARGPGDPGYDPYVDGCIGPVDFDGNPIPACAGAASLAQPYTGELFKSEMAALSWNMQQTLVALSTRDDDGLNAENTLIGLGRLNPCTTPGQPNPGEAECSDLTAPLEGVDGPQRYNGIDDDGDGMIDERDEGQELDEFDNLDPYRLDGCSYAAPQHCFAVQAFFAISGVQRNTMNAGGNGRFGRRDFIWHGGQDLALRYEKRNVLGFSADFAEDFTKTNWGFEFTWFDDVPLSDNDELDGISTVDTFNLTVSVDRPTFVNFLNANRTFFFNSQWFMQYTDGYNEGMVTNGPWNVLATFSIITGYFQDRLLPRTTLVYDFQSNSGAIIAGFTYRLTEAFSAEVGILGFMGREQLKRAPLTPVALSNRAGNHAYKSFAENALAVVREREEIYLRIKHTF